MDRRKAAVASAERDLASGTADAGLRETMKTLAWQRTARQDLRIDAIDALLADAANEADTRKMLALMLPTESAWGQWDVIAHIGAVAARRGWSEFATPLVASWARPQRLITDENRAEYAALAGLVGEANVVDTLFDVFAGTAEGGGIRERDRLAAWSLLQRIDPGGMRTGERLRALTAADPNDTLLAALKSGAESLGIVAQSGEQLATLERLRAPENSGFWRSATGVVGVLPSEARAGLELRHMAHLVWASRHEPSWLGMQRSELLEIAGRALEGRNHHTRSEASSGFQKELLRSNREKLVWADALTLLVAIEVAGDPGLASELFRIADIDFGDKTTEHGGVITPDASSRLFLAAHYPPRPAQRFGDNRFVASDDMIRAGAIGLFDFHFHASKTEHRAYAGPSIADIEYVDLFNRNGLVLTFIDADTLNVDYFQPGGAIVDLGELRRP